MNRIRKLLLGVFIFILIGILLNCIRVKDPVQVPEFKQRGLGYDRDGKVGLWIYRMTNNSEFDDNITTSLDTLIIDENTNDLIIEHFKKISWPRSRKSMSIGYQSQSFNPHTIYIVYSEADDSPNAWTDREWADAYIFKSDPSNSKTISLNKEHDGEIEAYAFYVDDNLSSELYSGIITIKIDGVEDKIPVSLQANQLPSTSAIWAETQFTVKGDTSRFWDRVIIQSWHGGAFTEDDYIAFYYLFETDTGILLDHDPSNHSWSFTPPAEETTYTLKAFVAKIPKI